MKNLNGEIETGFHTSSSTDWTVIRLKQLRERLGVGRSTIYDRMNPKSPRYDSTFPLPIKLSGGTCKGGAIGWLAADVCSWINSRIVAGKGDCGDSL